MSHRQDLYDSQDGLCADCMLPVMFEVAPKEGLIATIHHLLPKGIKGRGLIENKVLLCLNCHRLWHINHPEFNNKENYAQT